MSLHASGRIPAAHPDAVRHMETHVHSSPEHEVCGFLYANLYVPLRNLSPEPRRFQAEPGDVARALRRYGEPLAVVHSHPDGSAQLSAEDLRQLYYIYSTIIIATRHPDGVFRFSAFEP